MSPHSKARASQGPQPFSRILLEQRRAELPRRDKKPRPRAQRYQAVVGPLIRYTLGDSIEIVVIPTYIIELVF